MVLHITFYSNLACASADDTASTAGLGNQYDCTRNDVEQEILKNEEVSADQGSGAIVDGESIEISALEFLAALFRNDVPPNCGVAVCTKDGDPDAGGWWPQRLTKNTLLPQENNNYFCCGTFHLDGEWIHARKEKSALVHAFMLDDIGTKVLLERVGNFVLSYLIETSPGNFQGGIFLEQPITAKEADKINKLLIDAGLCDAGATSPATRWCRLHKGINGKQKYKKADGASFQCRLVIWNPLKRYNTQQIIEGLNLNASAQISHQNSDYRNHRDDNKVIAALKEHGLYKKDLGNGKHDITCPWVDQHTDRIDNGTVYFEPSSAYINGGFCCQHSHKDKYHIREFKEALGLSDAADKEPPAFVNPWEETAAPPFPLEVLSPHLREFVHYQHEVLGSTESAIAMLSLVGIIAVLDQTSTIQMTRHTGWQSRPRVWALIIGDPSSMKSPTMKATLGELEAINNEAVENAIDLKKEWQRRKAATPKNEFDQPEPPPAIRLTMKDVTSEKVTEILSRHPRGSNIIRDEIAGFIAAMDRYNSSSGADQAFYLETYDGGPRSKDRVSGEIYMQNASLNIIGGIQPDKLADFRDLQADGMLARFLPIPLGKPKKGKDVAHGGLVDQYRQMLRDAYSAPKTAFVFDQGGQEVCERVRDHIKFWETAGIYGKGFSSWVGKLPTLYGSLCISLAVSDWYLDHPNKYPNHNKLLPNIITTDVALRAEQIMVDYVIPVGVIFYEHMLAGAAREITLKLASFILTSDKERFVASDFTSGVRPLRGMNSWEIAQQISVLEAMGWLVAEGKGRAAGAWVLAKGLREAMAVQQQAEREHKAKVKAAIEESAAVRRKAKAQATAK